MSNLYIQILILLFSLTGAYHQQAEALSLREDESEYSFVVYDHEATSCSDLFDVDEKKEDCTEKYSELHTAHFYRFNFIPQTVTNRGSSYFVHFILFEADTSPPVSIATA